jgi:hypothetical protein
VALANQKVALVGMLAEMRADLGYGAFAARISAVVEKKSRRTRIGVILRRTHWCEKSQIAFIYCIVNHFFFSFFSASDICFARARYVPPTATLGMIRVSTRPERGSSSGGHRDSCLQRVRAVLVLSLLVLGVQKI